ncbi:hypothetical protein SNE40_015448 [Patella caerulea]|uniref:Uncharacterized protein n=1 Tax=Patella caerulea TaxID=87958 RepID=A0AAN8JKM4_PATCE
MAMANDLDTDAIACRIEHFDAALVFNENADFELAEKYRNFMNAINLDNGQKIKVCLFTAPNFKPEAAEIATDVVQYCTHIFCVLTKNFSMDLVTKLIKEEAIGLTRLAVNGEEGCPGQEGRRYCVRPLHSLPPGQRDYKIPPGFSTIRGFDMFDENRSKKELKKLFTHYLGFRLRREYVHKPTPEVNGCDRKPVTYFQLPNTSTISGELPSTIKYSINRISSTRNGQSNHGDIESNESTHANRTVNTLHLSSDNPDATRNRSDSNDNPGRPIQRQLTVGERSQISMDSGYPVDELNSYSSYNDAPQNRSNQIAPGGGDGTQGKIALSVKTSSSDHLQNTNGMVTDIGVGEHLMEYTSGLEPSVELNAIDYSSRPVNNETNRTGRDAKKYTNKPPNGSVIHFINCSNIQIGERGHWDIDKPNTIYKGTGQDQPTAINEDSDDDSEYEMEPEFGYRATPSTNQSSSKPVADLTGTQNQSSSKPMEDLTGTLNDLNMTSDKPWNIDSYENTEVKQLIETGPSPELNNSTVKDIPTKSVSNNNQAISSDQEGLGDNFLNVMNIFGSSDSNNLSLASFDENQDNLFKPQPTQDATPEVCDERILACLGTTGVIENPVLDEQEGGSGNNVNSNSLRSIWWQLSSMPRSVSFHNIAQLIGLQHTDTKPNGDDEETD